MKIAFLGDIALFGSNTYKSEYRKKFFTMRDFLRNYDYVIGNLETPLTYYNKHVSGKSAYIKGEPRDVEILKYLNVTHVTLANNHIYDYGIKGLEETEQVLDAAGIEWFGIKDKSVSIISHSANISLHGYCCYSTNGKGLGRYVNVLDPKRVEKDLKDDIKNGYMPVLSIHWGEEHVHYPNYDHVKMARNLASKYKFVIHGHHPHVMQGVEKNCESLIAYSLGNFSFDNVYSRYSANPLVTLSVDNKQAFILCMEIIDNKIKNVELVTFSFENSVYEIDEELKNKLDKWSQFLNASEEVYRSVREKDIRDYINGRKQMRNFIWYLKRLNTNSLEQIISSRVNHRKYCSLIRKYNKL